MGTTWARRMPRVLPRGGPPSGDVDCPKSLVGGASSGLPLSALALAARHRWVMGQCQVATPGGIREVAALSDSLGRK